MVYPKQKYVRFSGQWITAGKIFLQAVSGKK